MELTSTTTTSTSQLLYFCQRYGCNAQRQQSKASASQGWAVHLCLLVISERLSSYACQVNEASASKAEYRLQTPEHPAHPAPSTTSLPPSI